MTCLTNYDLDNYDQSHRDEWESTQTRSSAVYLIGLFTQSAAHHLFQIPNFLHLTPAAIKKHCEALKRNTFIWSLIELQYFLANICHLKVTYFYKARFKNIHLCCQHSAQSGPLLWTQTPNVTSTSPSKRRAQITFLLAHRSEIQQLVLFTLK